MSKIENSINLYCTRSFLLKVVTKFNEIISNKVEALAAWNSPTVMQELAEQGSHLALVFTDHGYLQPN